MKSTPVETLRARSEALAIAMLGKELAVKWWDSSNRKFSGITPNQQWEKDPESVYSYLMISAEGEW
jgi:hypothetical protein